MLRFFLVLIRLVSFAAPTFGASPWSIGPVSAWVDLQDPPAPTEELESEGGYRCLFHDEQVLEGVRRHGRFSRRVFLLESVEGARIFDGFSTDFDPSWQRVTLHWARILREGKVLDRMDPAKIRLLSREDRLEEGQIDGWRTIHLVLEDLRPGDVLDYAWTVEGSHPAFPEVASGSFHLSLPWVTERLRSRLIWDRPDSLHYRTFHRASQPVESREKGKRVLTWDQLGTSADDEPDNTPAWWTDAPSIDWSNLPDWASISRMQLAFYAPVDHPEPEVLELAHRLEARFPDASSRITGTLRYLQDSIRYLGYEGGIGSHVPRSAGTTLRSRQGDCKDKSLFMTALLRRMGIEAHPALVLTSGDRTLDERLPSPWFFNHVVVAVRLDGKTHVLDPTDRDQRGSLKDIPAPGSRWALILEADSKGLTEIQSNKDAGPSYELVESWDASAGPGKPARLHRIVVRRGRVAEGMRERLSKASLQKEIDDELEVLHKAWPGLRRTAPPVVSEDSASGEIRWMSEFVTDSFWNSAGTGPVWNFEVGSNTIKEAAWDPEDTAARKAPLSVGYPADVRIRVGVKLPHHEWTPDWDSSVVDLGPLSYRFRSLLKPDTFDLQWTWKTSDDHVLAKDLAQWAVAMDSIRRESSWTITLDRRSWVSKVNWPVVLLSLVVLVLASGCAWFALRWDPAAPAFVFGAPTEPSPWWVLYVLSALASPIVRGYSIWQGKWIFDPYQWNTQFAGAPEQSLLALVLLIGEIFWIPATIVLLLLYLRRRTSFPTVNAVVLSGMLGAEVVGSALLLLVGTDSGASVVAQTMGRIPAVLIWVSYFLVSKRANAVFTKGWRS